ncbi:MAG TPA: hypothetical protein PKH77_17740 [Anaerolineae bacterium]|nr:hypothetical protein [Anaerolineae bacterium]
MALEHAVAGAVRPNQSITWEDGDGIPLNLTGATITGKKRNVSSLVTTSIEGTLTVTDAANGVFVWAYAAADVSTAGEFVVQFTATFPSAPSPARNWKEAWSVLEAL